MSEIDHGIAASIGAVVSGAILGAKDFLTRRKKLEPAAPEHSSTLAVRVGRLYEDLSRLQQEMNVMRHDIAAKLDRVEESVDELRIARARTDEIGEGIRAQLAEIRQDLRDQRRHKE